MSFFSPKEPTVKIRVERPESWTPVDVENLVAFLNTESGQKFCAHARWEYLRAASQAVQKPTPENLNRAAGTVHTLAFLLEMAVLKELPDLAPQTLSDSESGNDDDDSATPSLHKLTQT